MKGYSTIKGVFNTLFLKLKTDSIFHIKKRKKIHLQKLQEEYLRRSSKTFITRMASKSASVNNLTSTSFLDETTKKTY